MSLKSLNLPESTVKVIQEIAARHGVVDVRLFGSVALDQSTSHATVT